MNKETSAGAVLALNEKEPKYLLLHHSPGHWDFPKGHVEH
ncbi:diadenosine tetraphosphate hydrolase, partial [Candidatus Woesearchaeota archaeon]|nr:diadenosine tetraphosphate hydrolase [Candidatus Woesearchaeota archaeon]